MLTVRFPACGSCKTSRRAITNKCSVELQTPGEVSMQSGDFLMTDRVKEPVDVQLLRVGLNHPAWHGGRNAQRV